VSSLPYDGTAGFVRRDASERRARDEAADGTATARQHAVLAHLRTVGETGATWAEAGDALGLHHGQISGALSVLHLAGEVFALRKKRNRSHVYVHGSLRDRFSDKERMDRPVKTRATILDDKTREALVILDDIQHFTSVRVAIGAIAFEDFRTFARMLNDARRIIRDGLAE
jgi:hypothetical protein